MELERRDVYRLDDILLRAGGVALLGVLVGLAVLVAMRAGEIDPYAGLPTPIDTHNLAEQLVLWRNHSHVRDVMVAGEWRVRGGEVLDADLGALRARTREPW